MYSTAAMACRWSSNNILKDVPKRFLRYPPKTKEIPLLPSLHFDDVTFPLSPLLPYINMSIKGCTYIECSTPTQSLGEFMTQNNDISFN